jgi:cell division protein FtsB
MKLVKYLAALWTGVFIYVLLSVLWGAMGLSAYRQLETERDKETANIEALRIINKDLENTKNALLYDGDILAVYAREHGYARQGDRFVRVAGAGNLVRTPLYSGQPAAPVPPEYTPDRFIRIFSFFAAFTVLVCIGTYDFLKYIRNRV